MITILDDEECQFAISFSREEIEQIAGVTLNKAEWFKVAEYLADRGINLFSSYFETRDGILADALDTLDTPVAALEPVL